MTNTKFRLFDILDWSRFMEYFENDPLYNFFNKLDNHSLVQLINHLNKIVWDDFCRSKGFYYGCIDILKKIAEERKFNIWTPQPFVENNPVAPLKRYKDESWVNHPLEKM